MIIETNDWTTVANYARKKKFSMAWAYMLIKNNKIESIKIDGIKFVKKDKK